MEFNIEIDGTITDPDAHILNNTSISRALKAWFRSIDMNVTDIRITKDNSAKESN